MFRAWVSGLGLRGFRGLDGGLSGFFRVCSRFRV